MRILIDECIDERFRNSLPGHDCQTARYAGLAGLKNGDLLTAAETAKFDVFLTVDQGRLNSWHPQNVSCWVISTTFVEHLGSCYGSEGALFFIQEPQNLSCCDAVNRANLASSSTGALMVREILE